MSKKPTYLGLLNAIALGEADGHRLFVAWAETTSNSELRRVLEVVAIREAEHAAVFTKRISELGFKVRDRRIKTSQNTVDLARSTLSDKKKFKKILGISRKPPSEDRFSELFKDTSMDPTTSALLGRYIAEERDSGRLLRSARASLEKEIA
jgi:rubrerythrin